MKYEDYLKLSSLTDIKDYDPVRVRVVDSVQFLHAVLGLGTEVGELQDALKRWLIYGKPIDKVNVVEELGDLFWYAALLARELGVSFEDVMARNIAKLKKRYPDGFTEHDALNRDLTAERDALL